MSSIRCNVVLLPDVKLASRAIAASKNLAKFNSLFVLEEGRFYPHLSLYMLQLKIEDLDIVGSLLSDIAQSFSPFQLHTLRYDHTAGYIDAEYDAIPDLIALQNQVIHTLNSIRDGIREKDVIHIQEATGLALKNYQEYGYPNVGELFRPHITLSRLSDNNPDALAILNDKRNFDGTFLRLGLFEMGANNGTCIRKITAFELTAEPTL